MALRMQQPMIRLADTSIARVAPKVAAPIYSTPEYERWRAAVIKRANGRCQDAHCRKVDRRASRLFADHVVELKDGGAPFDVNNGLARCGSCHTRKTAAARAARQRGTPGLARCDAVAPRNNMTPGGIKISTA